MLNIYKNALLFNSFIYLVNYKLFNLPKYYLYENQCYKTFHFKQHISLTIILHILKFKLFHFIGFVQTVILNKKSTSHPKTFFLAMNECAVGLNYH